MFVCKRGVTTYSNLERDLNIVSLFKRKKNGFATEKKSNLRYDVDYLSFFFKLLCLNYSPVCFKLSLTLFKTSVCSSAQL